jgi:parvulin-like peptidyl-prolyl isomerase
MAIFRSLLVVCPVACLLAQTPPPKAPATKSAPSKSSSPAAPKAASPAKPVSSAKPVAATAAGKPADPSDKVVVSVGNAKITAKQFDMIIDALPAQYQAQVRQGDGKKQFGENLKRMLVLSEEAKRRKLDQDPQFQAKAKFNEMDMLASMVYSDLAKDVKIDDAAMRAYYDEHKGDFETVSARHILIRMQGSPVPVAAGKKDLTEDEAKAKCEDLRKQIEGGKDFGELAKAESDDVESGKKGGDLGAFGHNQMVQPFESTAFGMKPGEVSQPVKTQFGYHLIKVDAHSTKPFEEAKADIEQKLRPEMVNKAMEDLEKKAGGTIDADFFAPAKQ